MTTPASIRTLSEAASIKLLRGFGIPVTDERECRTAAEAASAAAELGFPVVAKLCGDNIAHKTERGLVRLGLASTDEVERAAAALLDARTAEETDATVLIAPMVSGHREFICGVYRDEKFGPMVMLGVGGVLTEALDDVVMGVAPLTTEQARSMIQRLRTQGLLGETRGEPPVDLTALAALLVGLSQIAVERPEIVEIDLNPVIISHGQPVAVDALVVERTTGEDVEVPARGPAPTEAFDALFNPGGIIVAGASSHPGKFGFVTLHNIRSAGFRGALYATKLDGEPVLGEPTRTSLSEVPSGECDLLVICTPASTVMDMLPEAAERGVKAVFMTTAGYGESGEAGRAAQAELVLRCAELGLLLAGPNGQGVVSTPAALCAQIVAPYPPAGTIAVASQSGNLVSSFLNHAVRSGVGVSRAISAGNAAATGVIDYLEYFAEDPATAVSLTYVEGIEDGRDFYERLRRIAPKKPIVVVKGGATSDGAKAAASHTGSLASDDRVVDAVLAQAGTIRAEGVEDAFDTAAAFATLPAASGGRVAVVTTVGGWGVLASDAISRSRHLELATLSPAAFAEVDTLLPPRWSKNNPIDMAGGETRDSVSAILRVICGDSQVDAVLFLGLGIQSNQASLMRNGPFYPEFGLERIVNYHERQDRRYVEAIGQLMAEFDKPILVATELVATDPHNAGPVALRELGMYGFSSAERAVDTLDNMVGYYRGRHGQ
jgi:acyl-CoA synthetase (NDP forming)